MTGEGKEGSSDGGVAQVSSGEVIARHVGRDPREALCLPGLEDARPKRYCPADPRGLPS